MSVERQHEVTRILHDWGGGGAPGVLHAETQLTSCSHKNYVSAVFETAGPHFLSGSLPESTSRSSLGLYLLKVAVGT